MEFQAEIARVVAANLDEIRGDLDQARNAVQRTRVDLRRLEAQVARFETLLELADEGPREEAESAGLTLHEAMAAVLRESPAGQLRAGDLASEIGRQHLYRMRDGRPVEAQQIHARVGNYPHLFEKEGTFIRLVDN